MDPRNPTLIKEGGDNNSTCQILTGPTQVINFHYIQKEIRQELWFLCNRLYITFLFKFGILKVQLGKRNYSFRKVCARDHSCNTKLFYRSNF